MKLKVQKTIWLTWLIVLPITIALVYIIFPPHVHVHWIDILSLAFLMIVISFFYFQVRGTDIIVFQGISLAIFLLFGLFTEMMLMQLAILTFILSKRLRYEEWYRYPVNSLMFLCVSVISGSFYYLINGKIGLLHSNEYPHLMPILGYSFMVFLTNHLFLYLFRRIVLNTGKFASKDMIWEGITTALLMPIGIVLYVMYSELGTLAIYFIAVPAVTLSVIFRLVNSSYKTNVLLQKTSEIGQQLTEKLDVENSIDLFFDQLGKMFDPDFAYILDLDSKGRLHILRLFEKEPGSIYRHPDLSPEGISKRVGRVGRSFHANSRKQWRHLSKGFLPFSTQSIISVPMKRSNKVIGVITVASKTKRAYQSHQLKVLEILANFLAVAIENANNYKKTKDQSERCPLTNLYNYRFFTNLLESHFNTHKDQPFSIVMMDLDHFKNVNDQYGHESGNKVLCQVADVLVDSVGDTGTVARYGGEEFIIFLPDRDGKQALEIAEKIRMRISNEVFLVDQLKGDLQHQKSIHVTASIGVATAPNQGEDPLSLIRNADRAMYTGAKQKGRNRVAAYVG